METANRVMISSVNGDYDPSGKKRNMWIQTSLQAVMQNQKTQQNKTGARSKTGYICWNKEKIHLGKILLRNLHQVSEICLYNTAELVLMSLPL